LKENKAKVERVLQIADVDKNGQISFTEFFFFVLICHMSEKAIRTDFKKAGGKMNMKQFSKNLTAHRKRSHFAKKDVKRLEQDFLETNRIMTENIFDGKSEITLNDFLEIRGEIQQTLWHYEFCQFKPDKNGNISAHDFSYSLIVYFPFHYFQEYTNHLN